MEVGSDHVEAGQTGIYMHWFPHATPTKCSLSRNAFPIDLSGSYLSGETSGTSAHCALGHVPPHLSLSVLACTMGRLGRWSSEAPLALSS